ncbi:MAG: AMP-binding protein [Christensenellaceae bacterium]
MKLLNKFLKRTEFEDYADFKEHFEINVPEDFNYVRDVIDVLAEEKPNKLALLYCNDEGEEQRFTFGDVARYSKQIAAYFAAKGIGAGDSVITLLRRRWEYWMIAVALHRLGALLVPGSIQLMKKDIAYRVEAAQAKMIVAIDDAFVLEQLEGQQIESETLEHILIVGENTGAYEDFHASFDQYGTYEGCAKRKQDDSFIAYFTSGTTGYPKMAVHNQTYALGHIVTAKYMQCVRDGGLHLTLADSGWAKFGWGNLYGQWIAETAILAYDPIRFQSKNLMHIMEKYAPTTLCIPPTMYRFLLNDGVEKKHIASIEWYSTAGEPLSPKVNEAFFALSGHEIHEGFGQSEGTPITCSYEWLEVRPGSMGKPSPLYDVAIVDKEGMPLEAGESGEVIIYTDGKKTPIGLLAGYIIDGVFTRGYDEIYHTGDIAYADEDGYYWYVGRNDDMIKCSGYRIGPFEIESVLNTHPAIKESAIVGRPDELRGQVVCAVVALREGFAPSDALTKELQEYVKTNTAPYKYPRIVEYMEALPKTTSGKIIRNVLTNKEG